MRRETSRADPVAEVEKSPEAYAAFDPSARGLLLTRDVCRKLRISQSQYHRLEAAGVFPQPKRWGRAPRPGMRVFAPGDVALLRHRLAHPTGRDSCRPSLASLARDTDLCG